jgi:hypothetical protein
LYESAKSIPVAYSPENVEFADTVNNSEISLLGQDAQLNLVLEDKGGANKRWLEAAMGNNEAYEILRAQTSFIYYDKDNNEWYVEGKTRSSIVNIMYSSA